MPHAVALDWGYARDSFTAQDPGVNVGRNRALFGRLAGVGPRRLTIGLAVLAATLLFASTAAYLTHTLVRTFGLDSESSFAWPVWQSAINIPALVSSLMLLLAAYVWVTVPERSLRRGRYIFARWALAAGFAFMALDESLRIHERIEEILRIDWQILYAPIAAILGLAGWAILMRLRVWFRPAAAYLAGGAVLWLLVS